VLPWLGEYAGMKTRLGAPASPDLSGLEKKRTRTMGRVALLSTWATRNAIADAGLEDWCTLVEGDALESLAAIDDVFDVVFLDARKDEYEDYFAHARRLVEPGALVLADNVLSHEEILGAYSRARQSDPTLVSVTVPLDRGIEVTAVLKP